MDSIDHALWRESVVLVSVVMTELLVGGTRPRVAAAAWVPDRGVAGKQETLPAGRVNG